MKNANVLRIRSLKFYNPEDREKWSKWYEASFSPMLMSSGLFLGTDWLDKIEGNPEMAKHITLWYLDNVGSHLDFANSPEWAAYLKDMNTTWGGKYENDWSAVYLLAKRIGRAPYDRQTDTAIEDSSVVYLEGLTLLPNEWDNYHRWLYEWGYQYYLPLILKVPGVNEYSRWLFYNIRNGGFPTPMPPEEEAKYPADLSVFYFDDMKAFQDFEKSKELLLYRKAIKSEFPDLSYKWGASYQLHKSWRK
jgi:hypothetical protein